MSRGFRAAVGNVGTFWSAVFLQTRCRTTNVIDVLRGSQFSTAAGGLMRVLFERRLRQ